MAITGVYLARAVGTSRIKIGWSKDVQDRIDGLKTGCPYPIELLNVIEGHDPSVEKDLHEMLKAFRVHGEWFVLPEDVFLFLMGASTSDILSVKIAKFLSEKDLSGICDASKVEQIRRMTTEVLSGRGL